MTHWHEFNPWGENAVYVPVEELAACIAGGTIRLRSGAVTDYTPQIALDRMYTAGDRLDAYILPQPDGRHVIGVRYGTAPEAYLAPHPATPDRVEELLAIYSRDEASFLRL